MNKMLRRLQISKHVDRLHRKCHVLLVSTYVGVYTDTSAAIAGIWYNANQTRDQIKEERETGSLVCCQIQKRFS